MSESSRQVRVDNWGIYFLQRLQLFFSKTDFCDLTLQFEGNAQLKVHRLVMNACTEYFAFLEQSCPALEENTILMPSDLQADVVVPIVNFMYTGMLEFHPSIYDKLYRAAETMNIAVLTKLLEAQLGSVNRINNRLKRDREKDTLFSSPSNVASPWKEISTPAKKFGKFTSPVSFESSSSFSSKKPTTVYKRKGATGSGANHPHPVSATFNNKWNPDPIERDPLAIADNTPKPTRFEWPEEEDLTPISMSSSFHDVSLTSKPLWTKEDDHKAAPVEEHKILHYPPSCNSNNASSDCEDEFLEPEQKVNVGRLTETLSNEVPGKRRVESKIMSSPKRVKISSQEDETIISITTSNPSEIDHTKIVSDVLKRYPDLVKKKKNIKLKITQTKSEPTAPLKVHSNEKTSPKPVQANSASVPKVPSGETKNNSDSQKDTLKEDYLGRSKAKQASYKAVSDEGPWICLECFHQDRKGVEFVLYYLFRKHMADEHQMEFDSTLCKYCGKKCLKENHMVYHLYTKHGLKPLKDVVFPKCSRCPFIAVSVERLQDHMSIHGKDEVQCPSCKLGFLSKKEFMLHQQIAGHCNKRSTILDCSYCAKKFQSPVMLFTHVRVQHKKEAKRDGITSLEEIMDVQEEDNEEQMEKEDEFVEETDPEQEMEFVETKPEVKQLNERVKILSNVKVSRSEDEIRPENSSNKPVLQESAVGVTTPTSLANIGSSLATNLGLVDIVVLDDNQQYILQQPQGPSNNAEFILPTELTSSEGILRAAAASGELNSTDELVMVLTDQDYPDEPNQGQSENSNIVVLYSHPVEGQQGQFITSQGNILVNSEGVLEIRNGAAITTTAGQILMNNGNTTTTQAIESPVESIDLIRKEIEDIESEPREEKTDLRVDDIKPGNEISPEVVINNKENNGFVESNKDVTDSSMQDESMEVDESMDNQKEVEVGSEQDEVPESNSALGDQQSPIPEESNDDHQESQTEEGQDVPPHANSTFEYKDIINNESSTAINSPQAFETSSPEREQMQVDGGASTKIGPDETDPLEFPSNGDNEEVQTSSINENNVNEEVSKHDSNLDISKDSEEDTGQQGNSDVVSNENAQTHYEDFTDESQQSSGQKKDVNKEILEDWEDTDSQQSHGPEQENQEDEDCTATKANDNVNKLMDDWDEEDEDHTKD